VPAWYRPVMKTISTEIRINASVGGVWNILTDFPSYPSWNPFIEEIKGRPEIGSRLTITIHPPGEKSMRFKPSILEANPGRELRWLGHLLFPGVFDGEHSFVLTEAVGGCVLFHSENFSGLLPMVMGSKVFERTEQGFRLMNEALKRRAEQTT
jgi:hypothetical protein